MPHYALTGATGHLGRIALEDLLGRVPAADVSIVVRNLEKARAWSERGIDVRFGDYSKPESLAPAFEGVDVLLFVSSPDLRPGIRVGQHRAVVDAAKAAGVGRIVYTSAIGAGTKEGDHRETELAIQASGLTYTFLRNSFYTDFFASSALLQARAGEITSAAAGHALNTATTADLAVAASLAMTGEGHDNAIYELRGPLWTYPELAEILTKALGHDVVSSDVSDEAAGPLRFLFPIVRNGALEEASPDLERLLGRAPTSIADAVAKLLAH